MSLLLVLRNVAESKNPPKMRAKKGLTHFYLTVERYQDGALCSILASPSPFLSGSGHQRRPRARRCYRVPRCLSRYLHLLEQELAELYAGLPEAN